MAGETSCRSDFQVIAGPPQLAPPPLPSSWIGGHGTVPYEQKTQQSSSFGRNSVLHAAHS